MKRNILHLQAIPLTVRSPPGPGFRNGYPPGSPRDPVADFQDSQNRFLWQKLCFPILYPPKPSTLELEKVSSLLTT